MGDAILADLEARIREAAAAKSPLVVRGGGTKDFYGQAIAGEVLDTTRYAGIIDYDATELVLTARAGTRLADIESTARASGQMLALRGAALRRCRDARRHGRRGIVGPATPLRRRRPRHRPRRAHARRQRRGPRVRRPRDEERRRLRPAAAHGGRARHAGRADRNLAEVRAAAQGRGDAGTRVLGRRCDPPDQRVGRQAAAGVGDLPSRGPARRAAVRGGARGRGRREEDRRKPRWRTATPSGRASASRRIRYFAGANEAGVPLWRLSVKATRRGCGSRRRATDRMGRGAALARRRRARRSGEGSVPGRATTAGTRRCSARATSPPVHSIRCRSRCTRCIAGSRRRSILPGS